MSEERLITDEQPARVVEATAEEPARVAGEPLEEPAVVVGEPVEEAAQVVEETVDGLPVLAEVRPIERSLPAVLPAVQAAAAAATGFVAGAATLALVRRHSARKLARARTQRSPIDMLPIVGSRTFLVDVHLIAKPGGE